MRYPTPLRLTACLLLGLMLLSCSSSSPGEQPSVVLTGLSDHPDLFDWRPTWSPDGSKVAFASERDGNYEIYVIDADGSNEVRLTTHPEDDWRPKWSPDGTKIAFGSERDGNWEIYVMDADGSNPRRLTNHPAREERMTWSPDGSQIAFDSDREGQFEIYVMDAAGGTLVRLTTHEGFDGYPAWSPDETQIAFTTDRDDNRELYVMDVDGANPLRLTENTAMDQAPAWSPDGEQIAFFSTRDGDSEIYVMDAHGQNSTRLTQVRGWDFMPAWSPDGEQIAFDSRRDGRRGIYVMEADGSNPVKISNTAVSAFITVARRQGVDEALRRYRVAKAALPEEEFFVDAEVDLLAYELLNAGEEEEALKLFIFNTEVFPNTENVFLSLGDVQTRLKNKAEAIQAYEQALALEAVRISSGGYARGLSTHQSPLSRPVAPLRASKVVLRWAKIPSCSPSHLKS